MKLTFQKIVLGAALIGMWPLAAKRGGDDAAEERAARERDQRIRAQIENKRDARDREERQQAINKYVGAVEANGGQAPKWAQKSEGAQLYNEVNQKFQASINVAQQNAAAMGAAQGLSPSQIAAMQAQLKADIRAGGTIAPAVANSNGNIQNMAAENRRELARQQHAAGERTYSPSQTAAQLHNAGEHGYIPPTPSNLQAARTQQIMGEKNYVPTMPSRDPLAGKTPAEIQAWAKARGLSMAETRDLLKDYSRPTVPTQSTKGDPLAGMTLQEIEKWARERKLSPQETRDLLNDYRNNNTTVVFGTVGLTDPKGKAYLDMVCPPGNTNVCKQGGYLNVYGDSATGSSRPDMATDFLMDKHAMDIYQKFIDQAKFNPNTGKVEIPDKICLTPNGRGGCADWQYRNEAVVSLGGNPFSKRDDQTYMSVDQILTSSVTQACGGKKCNGMGQDVVMAGHSAGGVSGTLAAIALNNAGFDVEKMSGYEMVMNNGQYNILQDMGVKVTNYSAATNVPDRHGKPVLQISTMGAAIALGEGKIDSAIAGTTSSDRPKDYYTGYVYTGNSVLNDFNGATDLPGGHKYENAGVVPTIQTALFTSSTPQGLIDPMQMPSVTTPRPVLLGPTANGTQANAATPSSSTGVPLVLPPNFSPNLVLPKVPVIPPPVKTINQNQLPVGDQDYVPPMTPTPPAP